MTVLRHAETADEIATCFPVMRQLRPNLVSAEDMAGRVQRQQREGYRLLGAWRGDVPVALAGYRYREILMSGRVVYVDDLVVDGGERRGGLGARLLDGVAAEAKAAGCLRLTLDTGLGNALAQRFYYRWGLLAGAMHFGCALDR
jgi:GNAT superfamily N-acetyltransferase